LPTTNRWRVSVCGSCCPPTRQSQLPGECRNGREVVAALRENRYDVLFLDIEMPGGNGFEIVEQVGLANMPVTVFVTAHDHYAVKAFEVHALDYLTKPVEPERLQTTLTRIKERIALQAALMTQTQLKSVLAALKDGEVAQHEYPKRLVHSGLGQAYQELQPGRYALGWSRSHPAELRTDAAPGRVLAAATKITDAEAKLGEFLAPLPG